MSAYPFDGSTLEPEDIPRLETQLRAVMQIMVDAKERTLFEIEDELLSLGIVASVASISARLRDFRKAKFGGHIVERRNAGGGLFFYRLLLNSDGDGENRAVTIEVKFEPR